jgi:hypothetical protein
VPNPELRGAKNFNEFYEGWKKQNTFRTLLNPLNNKLEARVIWQGIGPKNTKVIQGGISPRYIQGSKYYKPETAKEIINFIKKNPKKFAKGVGAPILAAIGTALASSELQKMAGAINILKGSDDLAKALLIQNIRNKGTDKAHRVASKMLWYSAKKKYPNKLPIPKN